MESARALPVHRAGGAALPVHGAVVGVGVEGPWCVVEMALGKVKSGFIGDNSWYLFSHTAIVLGGY